MTAAMGVSDIELNDVPDMRQDQKEIDAPARDDDAARRARPVRDPPRRGPGADRARDTVTCRVARAAASSGGRGARGGLKKVASALRAPRARQGRPGRLRGGGGDAYFIGGARRSPSRWLQA